MEKDNSLKIGAAYIRVSTEEQTEYSPDAQLVEIRKWAARNHYLVPDDLVFIDGGISGRQTAHRDEFKRMISMAKTSPRPFDGILLWKFSRFARNREDSVVYKSMLRQKYGIDVISVSEPIAEGKMGIISEAIIEAMDEFYSLNLSEEVRRGMSEKARRGGLQSTPAFGYCVQDNMLVPVPEEAEIVRQIFSRFLSGEGYLAIAKWLNSMGVKTHRGNPFEHRTVEYILRNPVYIGKLRWTPSHRVHRDFNDPDTILSDSRHVPLIDQDTWERAQQKALETKAKWKRHERPVWEKKHWLSGIVRCANCGNTLIFTSPHYFKCNAWVKGRCTTSQHIGADILEQAVLHRLERDTTQSVPLDFHVVQATSGAQDDLSMLHRKMTALDHKLARLKDAYLSGADTVEEYKSAKSQLLQEQADTQAEIERLESGVQLQDTAEAMRERIRSALTVLTSAQSTVSDKFSAANNIISSCTWSKETAEIHLIYRLIL